jgi:hypothetical protein
VTPRSLVCAALLLVIPTFAQQCMAAAAQQSAQPPAQPTQKSDVPAPPLQIVCTSASQASKLIGKHACVAGRVFRITIRKTGNTHLSLCPSRKCSFQAVVSTGDSAKVGDLAYLRGKIIAVVGDVTLTRAGHLVIRVRDRRQIRVAAGDAPPEFDAARPKPFVNGQRGSRFGSAW